MKVKFNRGPMANKRTEVQDEYAREYRIRTALPVKPEYWRPGWSKDFDSIEVEYKDGSYVRSNVTLKDGTVVFEWMGWKS